MNSLELELPIVFNAAEAKEVTTRMLYLGWLERYDVALTLPPTYQNLEPTDPIVVTTSRGTLNLRLTSINYLSDGRLECKAKYDAPAVYVQPDVVADEGQSVGATLTLDGPCVYSLLDIPLMNDSADTPGFPVAMAGYMSGWPGGTLYRTEDEGQTWNPIAGFTTPATIGYATNTITTHGGTVYDFKSQLAVVLLSGSLSSVTETQLFAGQNWFAYGADERWEIIAARTATLQGDGSYLLQDLLRGQQGTEWATLHHAVGDRLVLLNTTTLDFVGVNSSSIGFERAYRAITVGKSIDSDSNFNFTYLGVNLECLSPINLTGNRHPTTNDWTLTWARRSRFSGWRDYVDAALGETSEAYIIEVYSSGTYATLKRTLSSSTETVSYSSANQVTDFGSNQSTLYLKIYQVSATVGVGYPLTQSITR